MAVKNAIESAQTVQWDAYPERIDFRQYNGRIVSSGNDTRPLPYYLVDRGRCRWFSAAVRDHLFKAGELTIVLLDPDAILGNRGDDLSDNATIVGAAGTPYYLLDGLVVRGMTAEVRDYYQFRNFVDILPTRVFQQYPAGHELQLPGA